MNKVILILLWVAFPLSAHYEAPWVYIPIAMALLAIAVAGTVGVLSVSSAELARQARERNLGWTMYAFIPMNVAVLVYIGWHAVAVIYAATVLMGLIKRLYGNYLLG